MIVHDPHRSCLRNLSTSKPLLKLTLARSIFAALPIIAASIVILLPARPARAQTPSPTPTPSASPVNPCPTALMPGQSFIPVPVVGSANGKLQGTILLSDEQEWMAFRVPT